MWPDRALSLALRACPSPLQGEGKMIDFPDLRLANAPLNAFVDLDEEAAHGAARDRWRG